MAIANRAAYDGMIDALERFANDLAEATEDLRLQTAAIKEAMEGDDESEHLCSDVGKFAGRMQYLIDDTFQVKKDLADRRDAVFNR